MPQQPLISVIIPSHNYGRFLDDALRSVSTQTWQNWECIIVDDGSTDDTRQIAEGHCRRDARVVYIRQSHQGVSAARNAAIAASTGRYLQFLDADDLIENQKFATQVAFLETHPSVDLVYGDVGYFTGNGVRPGVEVSRRMRFPELSGNGNRLLEGLVRRNIMVVNSPLIRRSALDATGLFDPRLRGHEDWSLWIRLAMGGKTFQFLRATDSNALVRVHASSAVQNVVPMLHSNLKVRHELQPLLPTAHLRRINRFRIALQHARIAKAERRQRRHRNAWRHVWRAIVESKGDPRVLAFLLAPEVLSTWLAILSERIMRPQGAGSSLR